MEPIIVVVGFLGAGKTTLLKRLVTEYGKANWSPFVVLNDYENANLDAQQFLDMLDEKSLKALNGSCICCSGIGELRESVNRIPERINGITLIEANGTTDACALMGFLGVGIEARFMPPVQISVVDVKNWQLRDVHNELEANQIQISSLITLSHTDSVSEARLAQVKSDIRAINPTAEIMLCEELEINKLPELLPSSNSAEKLAHHKSHWSSCSVDLPNLPDPICIKEICDAIPSSVIRIKGCTVLGTEPGYTYFERCPDGEIYVRPYRGKPTTGAKLLTVGPGSDALLLESAIQNSLEAVKLRQAK
ncbi:GTP-binding protein [Pseudoalteromonas sp. MTN2-4]|uniref:GTP-binding protein n=1 Tax=Pseudoalteromonas sp. MTN2-4 TaxID=3056555 RepID=UPI0036F2EC6E